MFARSLGALITACALMSTLSLCACQRVDSHPDDRAPSAVQVRWQIPLYEHPTFTAFPKTTASPQYANNGKIVVAGSDSGDVVAVWSHTGKVIWRFSTEGKVRSTPTIVDNTVYIGSSDGKFYAINLKTGTEEWDQPYKTIGAITSAPAVNDDRVVFQNNENRSYALDRKTGAYAWDQGRPRPDFFTIRGEGGPTIVDNTVYAGYDDGMLVAMTAKDGATIWSKNLAANERHFVDVDTKPLVVGNTIYAGSFSVGMYAVGRKHGNVKWIHRAKGVHTPAYGQGLLFVATGEKELRALDPKTGKVQWRLKIGYGNLSSPVLSGNMLWISTGEVVLLVGPGNGSVHARLAPDDGQSAPVASSNGWVHMVTNSGSLVGSRVY
ncbi:MAG TPA: hypothetical protein EYN06_04645 [Myxococcales bacterium]|nr:hypothetical protein [Myxococcales bacterium]